MTDQDPGQKIEPPADALGDVSESETSPPAPKIKYRHTLGELEARLNRIMARDCKIDACIDLFICRVSSFIKDNPEGPGGEVRYLTLVFRDLQGQLPVEKLEPMLQELRDNLNRLIPGYVPDSVPVLDAINHRLESRLSATQMATSAADNQAIPQSLVSTLAEKQFKERTGLNAAASPEDRVSITDSCRQLRSLIEGERATASVSCGGTIPIAVDTKVAESKSLAASPPVRIFWSKGDGATAQKLVIPLQPSIPDASAETLKLLVADCGPASFGRGDQDVIDPEYRRAGKLDSDQFATSFHPADFGILDTIGQFRRIKAELYKMNVYSGPSGLFRKHVDTPCAANQIGSLVVSLPSKFTGGSLHVEHHGNKVTFDWSHKSDTAIQWAAFYSDCEHEIETITAGDRITLTYNLYVTEPIGDLNPSPTAPMDPTSLPMHAWIKDLLAKDAFLKDGGVLGFFCSHAYAHASPLAETHLPRALKGADLVLYSVFRSLGIEVSILPILDSDKGRYGGGNPEAGVTGKLQGPDGRSRWGYMDTEDWHGAHVLWKYLLNGKAFRPEFSEMLPMTVEAAQCEDVDRWWKVLLMSRRVKGMGDVLNGIKRNEAAPGVKSEDADENSFYRTAAAKVGAARHKYNVTDRGEGDDLDDVVKEVWPAYHLPGITWITEPKHEEMAFSQVAYGNQASIGTRYSCAAILAVIPPAEQRSGILRQG
ncbi:hypothetical protein BJY00DRAFT_311449 [Aspergillus carlsbadensis]|nr:hypothetical protein BJY00DRAFT_311449 [Aspergillus carlsbadensis]